MKNHRDAAVVPSFPQPSPVPAPWPWPLPSAAEASPAYEIFGVLARRWRLIAATVAATVAATAAYCLLATPWYEGRATVMIDARSPQLLYGQRVGEEQDPFISAKYDYYQTQFALLESSGLAERVVEQLKLGKDARFLDPGVQPGSVGRGELLTQYHELLGIEPVRGTRLVEIGFTSRHPDLAAEVANAHATLFVRRGMERLDQATEQIGSFLQAKLADLRSRMQAAELRLTRYQSAHRLLPRELTQGVANERFTDLSRRLTAAEAEGIALEAQHHLVREGGVENLPAVLENSLIQKLRGDLNALEVQHAYLLSRFRRTYPPVRELGSQIAQARTLMRAEMAKVAAGVEANHRAATRTVRELRKSLSAERRALLQRSPNEGELLRLTSDAETTRALHANILARIKELDIGGGAQTSNISVVEAAFPPLRPSSPATLLNLLLALVTGLTLGTGLAFLRDSLQGTVRDAQDLCRASGLDTLAVIPDFDAAPETGPERLHWYATRARTVAAQGLLRVLAAPLARLPAPNDSPLRFPAGPGPQLEAYRTLRTSLLLRRNGADPRVILVSSAAAREGKTTTAVNAALALAGSGRVLLIDGDLRLPCCHEALWAPRGPGLAEFLAGDMHLDPIQTLRHPNLFLLPAGEADMDPSELLASWRLAYLLDDVRKRFDYVLIDSPPLLAVSDGLLLASVADGVVLVAERERTATDRVQLAVDRLQGAGAVLLGTVLNRGAVEAEYYRYRYVRPADRNGDGAVTAGGA